MICLPRSDERRLVVSVAAQRAADEAAARHGTPSAALMDGAGTAAAQWMLDNLAMTRVVVLAGPGGNGGDGLVVARRMVEAGVPVRTFVVPPRERLLGASAEMADRLLAAAPQGSVSFASDREMVRSAIEGASHLVDALLGSGLSRPVEGAMADLVDTMNEASCPILSLDIPTGLPSDSGDVLGPTVDADVTLAMAFLYLAHLFYPAAARCGMIVPVDVPYPPAVAASVAATASVLGPAGACLRLPTRSATGHKGTFGRVLVVAGSRGMLGAAVLCCRSALRTGAGLVTLATTESLCGAAASAVPEALTLPLPERDGHVTPDAVDVLTRFSADVLAIGPGLSRSQDVGIVVRETVAAFQGPIVVDADGLFAYNECIDRLRPTADRLILTPHPGEMGRLIGRSPAAVDTERLAVTAAFVKRNGAVLVLKGRPTVVGGPTGVWLNPTGHDGLATGGTGDVLTGLIAGLLAGGMDRENASLLGAYVHGRCADVYAEGFAPRSLTASDLVERIPITLKAIESCA